MIGITADKSGNGQFFTKSGIAATDKTKDSPSNNFCTLNPLWVDTEGTAYDATFQEGNLRTSTATNAGASSNFQGTFGMTTGKWYWEGIQSGGTVTAAVVGITNKAETDKIVYFANGQYYNEDGATNYGASYGVDVVVAAAYDADNKTITFYRANSSQGALSDAVDGGEPYFPFGWDGSGSAYSEINLNFGADSTFAGEITGSANAQDSNGQGDFFYQPPAGYLALCSQNLPEPTVVPWDNFAARLWTGNGGTAGDITDDVKSFQPSFLWFKGRETDGDRHQIYDVVRGATYSLAPDGADAAITRSTGVTQFNGNGFRVSNHVYNNRNTSPYVFWGWRADTAFSNDASSTSVGSADSSGRTNVAAGFSIITYVGSGGPDTIAHGLGAVPEMIIVKNVSADNQEWLVYHHKNTAAPQTDYLRLDTTAATADNTFWNDTTPTTAVFSVGDSQPVNSSHGNTYIAYCWRAIEGYSEFEGYTGNNRADGPFIYTGFSPSFVLIKNTGSTNGWMLFDDARGDRVKLSPDTTGVESAVTYIDFLSNGFKLISNHPNVNGAHAYIYMAFAHSPFKYSNAKTPDGRLQ